MLENKDQEFDPDDETDPFEDDAEQINYPVKSLMPKVAMAEAAPQVIPKDEQGSGSGTGTMSKSFLSIALYYIIFSFAL